MEMILFIAVMWGGAVLFWYLGFLLWKREKIDVIHDYHHTKVREEEDKKAYTGVMGKAMIVIGSGMAISGGIGMFIDSVRSGIPFGIAFAVGLGMMLYGQIRYNRGLF